MKVNAAVILLSQLHNSPAAHFAMNLQELYGTPLADTAQFRIHDYHILPLKPYNLTQLISSPFPESGQPSAQKVWFQRAAINEAWFSRLISRPTESIYRSF